MKSVGSFYFSRKGTAYENPFIRTPPESGQNRNQTQKTPSDFSNAFLKLLRRTCRLLAVLTGIPAAGLIVAAFYFNNVLPDTYYLEDPSTFSLSQYRILEPVSGQEDTVQTLVGTADSEAEAEKMQGSISGKDDGQTIEYTLMLGGIIPVKTVTAVESEARYVIPSGSVFGLKMLTEGAVVASLSPIETSARTVCPAELAGIQSGDIILSANGQQIDSFDTLSSVISAAGESGQSVQITYSRDDSEKQTSLSPVQSTDGQWLTGMWVRDSSAGIGTITFYEPYSGCFAALGHGYVTQTLEFYCRCNGARSAEQLCWALPEV